MDKPQAEAQIEEFFRRVGGWHPALARTTMAVRIELRRALSGPGRDRDCWLLRVDQGHVSVSQAAAAGGEPAPFVIRADDWLFGLIVSGQENLGPAALRGDLTMDGGLDLGLLGAFHKLVAGPAGQPTPAGGDIPAR